ncbi:hypothetical protein K488DRAFT_67495 [Vararia minispora EC-137]|uniref:Uncharacterized protein n=1 Tax=Vararia minispora EC-137 TaxID=1314806 RepID=A0ACB8QXT8_9AGAM|nr:hypothetical protein K488DRAFT_67495 [Vararia minispora EC-137]
MPFFFPLARVLFLAVLLPQSFAIIEQIPFATAGQSTVVLSAHWTQVQVLLPQPDGSLLLSSAIQSSIANDFVLVNLPLGTTSVTCNGLKQSNGSIGVYCLDCGPATPTAKVFNTSVTVDGLIEAGLFTLVSLDPFAMHNLTIINYPATPSTLTLTRFFVAINGAKHSVDSNPATSSQPTTTNPNPTGVSPTRGGGGGGGTGGSGTDTPDNTSSSSGISTLRVVAAILISVLGSIALAFGVFIFYIIYIRRRRSAQPLPTTAPSPPMQATAARATVLTMDTPVITPRNSAVLRRIFLASPRPARTTSPPRVPPIVPLPPMPTNSQQRRAVVSLPAPVKRPLSMILLPPLVPSPRKSRRERSLPLLPKMDPEPDVMPGLGSSSLFSVVSEVGVPESDSSSARAPSSFGTLALAEATRPLECQGSAGDPVLPRDLLSPPGRMPSPSLYSIGRSSMAASRGEGNLRLSGLYPETLYSSELLQKRIEVHRKSGWRASAEMVGNFWVFRLAPVYNGS